MNRRQRFTLYALVLLMLVLAKCHYETLHAQTLAKRMERRYTQREVIDLVSASCANRNAEMGGKPKLKSMDLQAIARIAIALQDAEKEQTKPTEK